MAYNLKLGTDHDLIIGRGAMRVEGAELVLQNVKCRLLTFYGEWKRHPSYGLPWLRSLDRGYDLTTLEFVIRQTIEETNGVKSVDAIQLIPNNETRTLYVYFNATTEFGSASLGVSL